jgi:L-lactate dehydrogenase complex protein LldE
MAMPSGEPVLFPTCLFEQLRPDLIECCLGALRAVGRHPVVATGVTCCGQPAWNAGFATEARRVARASLRRLRRTSAPVVVPSGSCATMMRVHWPVVFEGTADSAAATEVAGRVVELSSYLDAAAPGAPEAATPPRSGLTPPVTVHDSCHALRELRVKGEPRRLLAAAGVEVIESDGAERCCGFGGTFSVKLPAVSVAMADDRLDEWTATGVQTVVGCDLSCLVHLEARSRRRSLPLRFAHVVEAVRATEG